MTSLKQYLADWIVGRKNKEVCCSPLIQTTREKVDCIDKSFTKIYEETRKLTSDILQMLEDERRRVKVLYSAFNASSDAIVVFDNKSTIIYANEKFSKLYNYTETELVGKSITTLRSDKTPVSVYKNLWETIKSNKVWEGVVTSLTKNFEEIEVTCRVLPIMNGKPEPIYYVCTQSKASKVL